MRKTPQDFKREEVRKIFDKVLRQERTILNPVSVKVSESLDSDFTSATFVFTDVGTEKKVNTITESSGKGFIDCLFLGLQKHYSPEYRSLEKIKMVNMTVNPFWSSSHRKTATDAKATVIFTVEGGPRGASTFQHTSRSMIHSSFAAALTSFQFYINCERSFRKIQVVLKDANRRNRFDIADNWRYYLSKLTEVNTYEKREEN